MTNFVFLEEEDHERSHICFLMLLIPLPYLCRFPRSFLITSTLLRVPFFEWVSYGFIFEFGGFYSLFGDYGMVARRFGAFFNDSDHFGTEMSTFVLSLELW